MEARITGHTTLLGLIGTPVGHSGSPSMYNYAFELTGIDSAYLAFDVPKEKAGEAMAAMKTFHMRGCNVTMPCKAAVIPYMDHLSPAAELMGAVNTIVNDDGILTGYNTDGEGFVNNLRDHDVEVKGKKIIVVGGGGAATAIQVQCALDGAKEIVIFKRKNETFAKTEDMAARIMQKVKETGVSDTVVRVCDLSDDELLKAEMGSSDIFINGTSVGMKPNDDESIVKDVAWFHKNLVVCDVVYNPIETKLIREAKECGCKTVGGKGMLLWQGVSAFKLYTGVDMPVEKVKEKYFSEA